MAQQILKFLLLVYTFLLPFQTRYFLLDSSVEYQRISIYGTQIIFLAVFVVFLLCHSRENGNPKSQNKQKRAVIASEAVTSMAISDSTAHGIASQKSRNDKSFSFGFLFSGSQINPSTPLRTWFGMTISILCILFIVLQLFVSLRIDLSIQTFFWILQTILFVWVVKRENLVKPVLWTFLASMALEALVIWVQFFTQYIPSSKWFGVAEHISSAGGVSVIETFGGRWLRGYGTFPHPNIAGGFLLIAIIAMRKLLITNFPSSVAEALLLRRTGKFQTNSNNQNSNHYLLLTTYYLLLGLLVSGLVLTFSRSALLGLVIFIIIQFMHTMSFPATTGNPENQNKQKKNPFGFFFSFLDSRRSLPRTEFTPYFDTGIRGGNDGGGGYLKFILILAVFLLVMTVPLRDLIFSRTSTSARLEKISVEQRIEYNHYAREIIQDNLWLGVGLGNYSVVLQKAHPELESYAIQPPHSVPLLVLSEIGILGALLLLVILIFLLLLTTHYSLLTIFIPLLPLLLFDHYLWSLYAGWGVIALAGVLGEHLRVPEGEIEIYKRKS